MKIRSDVLRVYKSLHTWVGITSGLLLFIGFYAGALTMFKQPLDRWAAPAEIQLTAGDNQQLNQLLNDVLQQHPSARQDITLYLTSDESIAAPLRWEVHEEQDEHGHGVDLDAQIWQAGFDSQGAAVSNPVKQSLLGDLIDQLHRTAGIPGHIGDEQLGILLLGVAGLLYALALISGLIILLPTLVKDFFLIRHGKNKKRFWLDAHNVIGITSLPFHLLIALTVVVFAFHDVFYGTLGKTVYGDIPMFGARSGAAMVKHDVDELVPVSHIIQQVKAAAPEFEVVKLRYMGLEGPRPLVRASIYNPDYLVRGPITAYAGVNPYSGEVVLKNMIPDESSSWGGIVMHFFALHFGSFGGDPVRWMYFLLGISGAFLFYSGNLLWVESRRKKQKRHEPLPQQSRSVRWMAAATVGVCLGCIAALSATISAAKLGHWLGLEDINRFYLLVYYGLFCSAVIWSFVYGAARSAVHLLHLCALTTLFIPLSTALGWLWPETGIWAHFSVATVMVDITALLACVVFCWGGRRALRRMQSASADSVWTLAPVK